MRKGLIIGIAVAMLAVPLATPAAARLPDTWDGLYRVKAKAIDGVYLLPDADFRAYSKVLIDTPEIAFKKNWQRDYNTSSRVPQRRVSDEQVRRIIDDASAGFQEILTKEYGKAGYQIATAPGPDVIRLSTAVINISVAAPDTMAAGRSRTYASEAGQATLVLEARDSVSGTLLGRAIDNRIVGDNGSFLRTSVSNRGDFEQVFDAWAKAGARGLTNLKSLSPVDADGALKK